MQWFTRLILGLPPRAQDINELRESVPEIFSSMETKVDWPHFHFYLRPLMDSDELVIAIRAWISKFEETSPVFLADKPCESSLCYRRSQGVTSTESSNSVLEMMVVAGGKPQASFYNMIDTTKIKTARVRRVIMTDPYIYSDIGESGQSGGFENFILLLVHLNIEQQDKFEIQLTPAPKKINNKKLGSNRQDLQNKIKENFENCTLGNHKSLPFHDRFIVVEYDNNKVRAWYGPSMNGLTSDSIVIFGDITETNAIKQLTDKLL